MRRTTNRRPTRLSESKLRQIIRSVIKESQNIDSEDLTYLSDMGIYSIDDAISHAMSRDDQLANESINRLMFKVIKESLGDDQKIMNAANLINNQIKDDSSRNLEKAADKISELQQARGARRRLRIVASALAVLGLSAAFAPLVLFIIAGLAGTSTALGGAAIAVLGKMGAIGTVISMAFGFTTLDSAINMGERNDL
jgi:hypothetical protein